MNLLVDQPLPPYSYVPGKFPHPESDAAGHHCPVPVSTVTGGWASDLAYLRGIDLFDHGFYWEAHEAWEAVWHRAGRQGLEANYIKAMIKLAAAFVKAREGRVKGVQRHARRARDLFEKTLDGCSEPAPWGLNVAALLEVASELAVKPAAFLDTRDLPVVQLAPLSLTSVLSTGP
jgi:hypothetical protein